MPFELRPADDGIVEVQYAGEVTYAERERALAAVATQLIALERRMVLIDGVRAQFKEESFTARLSFMAKITALSGFTGARIAFFGVSRDVAYPVAIAASTMNAMARHFPSRGAAREWLMDVSYG